LPDLESRKLGDLCNYYGIAHRAHRALEDAEASSGLYQKLAELFYKGNEEAFMPRKLLFEAKKEMPVTKRQKERLYKLLDRHRITIEYQVDKLTKSEADRIMDQIVAKYGR
jgi:DNA polymerase-3 subunit alpha (Gram-positive type)